MPTANVLRVYLSSTIKDLEAYRQAALNAIARAGGAPIAAEGFGATDEPLGSMLRRQVRKADVLVLILAHRYGAVLSEEGVSVSELEFAEARALGLPTFAFIVDDKLPWLDSYRDTGKAARQLARFKARVGTHAPVQTFTTPSDLANRIAEALAHHTNVPPPRAVEDTDAIRRIEAGLEALRVEMARLFAQLQGLAASNASPQQALSLRPPAFLGAGAKEGEPDLCFVAMPYSEDWSEDVFKAIKGICESEGSRVQLAKNMSGRFIPHDIWTGITAAGVIVADITGGNPNVAYEVGLADLLGKEVVLVCQKAGDTADVPFDFLGHRLILYSNSIKGSIELREELAVRLRNARTTHNET